MVNNYKTGHYYRSFKNKETYKFDFSQEVKYKNQQILQSELQVHKPKLTQKTRRLRDLDILLLESRAA